MFQLAPAGSTLRTFVVRLDPTVPSAQLTSAHLRNIAVAANGFATVRLLNSGDRRVAVVLGEMDDAVHFVHTTAVPKRLSHHADSLTAAVRAFPVLGQTATVRWVRPLNRHLQRAFG